MYLISTTLKKTNRKNYRQRLARHYKMNYKYTECYITLRQIKVSVFNRRPDIFF